MRLPLNKIGSINRINKAFARLEQEHERPPTAAELAETLEMSLDEVKTSMGNTGRHLSMDAPLRDDGDSGTMHDLMRNDDQPDPMNALLTDSLRGEIERTQPLVAPLSKGQRIGTIRVRLDDQVLAERPLVALADVPPAGIIGKAWDSLLMLISR